MAHVVDVDRSSAFYALLGFACDSRFSGPDGRTTWSALSSGKARLFLARASEPVRAEQQGVLFYMYSDDVVALRAHLLSRGLRRGGPPPSEGGGDNGTPMGAAVYDIVPRFYMPRGELRVHDPDGYVLLVGQLG